MTPREEGRTEVCSSAEVRIRLQHARKFLEVAQLIGEPGPDIEYASATAALAVLAGIAASDAACCQALRRRSRGQDHRQATRLIEQIEPGGRQAANALSRLLNLNDQAHYGLFDVSGENLQTALRQAEILVEFDAEVLRR